MNKVLLNLGLKSFVIPTCKFNHYLSSHKKKGPPIWNGKAPIFRGKKMLFFHENWAHKKHQNERKFDFSKIYFYLRNLVQN